MTEQYRNILFFLLFSAAVIGGWFWLKHQFPGKVIPDTAEKDEKDKNDEGKNAKNKKEQAPPKLVEITPRCALAMLGESSSGSFLSPLIHLNTPYEHKTVRMFPERVEFDQRGALALLGESAGNRGLPQLVHLGIDSTYAKFPLGSKDIEIAKAKQPDPKTELEPIEPLGGDNFFLKVVLSRRGAGIQKLTLTKFYGSDWYGRPAYQMNKDGEFIKKDGDKQQALLDLIPEDPFRASFLMYHYKYQEGENAKEIAESARTALGKAIWELDSLDKSDDTKHSAQFSTILSGAKTKWKITKTYTLLAKDYHINLKIKIENIGKEEDTFRYQLTGAHGMPIEGVWYTHIYRNALIGRFTGGSTSNLYRDYADANTISRKKGGNRVPEKLGTDVLDYAAVVTRFFASAIVVAQDPDEDPVKDVLEYARATHESEERHCKVKALDPEKNEAEVIFFDKKGKEERPKVISVMPYAMKDLRRKVEVEKMVKLGETDLVVNQSRAVDGGFDVAMGFRLGTVPKRFLEDITVRVVSQPKKIEPNDSIEHEYLLYHGPVKVSQLGYQRDTDKIVDEAVVGEYIDTYRLDTLTDYPSEGFIGTICKTIYWTDLLILTTKLMHWLLNMLYAIIGVEGLSIILLTVMVRGLMFPISRRQALISMKMQELAPVMKELQEKYKDDPMAKQQAVWDLYRKHKVNPVGGCLPLLLQMPFFLGLYYALQESTLFRLANFLWISNLAAPDMTVYWGQGFPMISDFDNLASGIMGFLYLGPYLNILPIIAVTVMIFYQRYTMPPPTDEQQAAQQNVMKYMMIFIGVMFYKVAAGLVMYFIVSSAWGMAERKLLPKKKTTTEPAATTKTEKRKAPTANSTGGKGKGKQRGKKNPPAQDSKMKGLKDMWQDILNQAKKK